MNEFWLKFLMILCISATAVSANFAQASKGAKQPSPTPPTVDMADDGVPVLVKHLPDWETAQKRAKTATKPSELQAAAGNRPILETIDFNDGVEAVTADYDSGRLVIVEFPTPQSAIDGDAKIKAKLAESPNTIYRKVGNYSVFVFDAANDGQANSLVDKVTYEKEIRWLGENPFDLMQMQREYAGTAGDVILTTVKVAGLSVAAALGFGGLVGALIFFHRRRQQSVTSAFSDAGGMLRLNLDEMTPRTDSARLIEGEQ